MKLNIISVTQKMPLWVSEGLKDYGSRFPRDFSLNNIEIPLARRTPSKPIQDCIEKEGNLIQTAFKRDSLSILLDVKGNLWSTEDLANHLEQWQQKTSTLNFVIGGPDGLSQTLLKGIPLHWSLSPLTLPHFLVKIILTEQLYRAVSILKNHPYHRG